MTAPRRLQLRRGNTAAISAYVGAPGELIVNTDTKTLYLHDGVTVGGIATTVNTASIASNISALESNVSILQGNILTLQSGITTLTSNAAVQAGLIANAQGNYSNANVSSYLPTYSGNIGSINLSANLGAVSGTLTTLTSNAASQAGDIATIYANLGAVSGSIATLTSNAAVQAGLLDTLTGNAASQGGELATLVANAATQAGALATLTSNAASQSGTLADLIANAAVQAGLIAGSTGTYGNANVAAYLPAYSGNISANIVKNGNTWTFGSDAVLTLPSGGTILESGYLSAGAIRLKPNGGTSTQYLEIAPTAVDGNHVHLMAGSGTELFLGDDNQYVKLANTGGVVINSNDGAGNTAQWTFGQDGTTLFPNQAIDGGTAPIELKSRSWSQLTYNNADMNQQPNKNHSTTFYVEGGDALLEIFRWDSGNVLQHRQWTFDSTGNLTLPQTDMMASPQPASYPGITYTDGSTQITAFSNSAIATYLQSGNIANVSVAGNVSISSNSSYFLGNSVGTTAAYTGNVSANYFTGNGTLLTGVAIKTTGSWTVPTGNSTQSFTVASGTYQLWVDCNIPNGILAWNATATVTNTNVPVVGAQYAWVYTGGGTPVDFTSIPNQFVGTGNTIVRNSTAPSATTNRFDFGINNTSGGNVTVRYGYVKIS